LVLQWIVGVIVDGPVVVDALDGLAIMGILDGAVAMNALDGLVKQWRVVLSNPETLVGVSVCTQEICSGFGTWQPTSSSS
jgi:hypothetical protein